MTFISFPTTSIFCVYLLRIHIPYFPFFFTWHHMKSFPLLRVGSLIRTSGVSFVTGALSVCLLFQSSYSKHEDNYIRNFVIYCAYVSLYPRKTSSAIKVHPTQKYRTYTWSPTLMNVTYKYFYHH
jgi:hypothetical protein